MLRRAFLRILLIFSFWALEGENVNAWSLLEAITAQNDPSLWINSPPLTDSDLKNKVVLIEFWTFDCGNCQNSLPYMKKWYEEYKDKGLIIIGVHSPELQHEREVGNLKKAISNNEISYPVLMDNNFEVWRAFHTRLWPTIHVLNRSSQIVHTQVGDGNYEATEAVIQRLIS